MVLRPAVLQQLHRPYNMGSDGSRGRPFDALPVSLSVGHLHRRYLSPLTSKAISKVTIRSVDSARLRCGSLRAACSDRRTLGYSRKPDASIRLSWMERPKNVTDTASKASEIWGENIRILAAARMAPARPSFTSTWGLKTSTNRSIKTSRAGRCELNRDNGPQEKS